MLDNCAGEEEDAESLAERKEDRREKMASKAVLLFNIYYILLTIKQYIKQCILNKKFILQ